MVAVVPIVRVTFDRWGSVGWEGGGIGLAGLSKLFGERMFPHSGGVAQLVEQGTFNP